MAFTGRYILVNLQEQRNSLTHQKKKTLLTDKLFENYQEQSLKNPL